MASSERPLYFQDVEHCVDQVIETVGNRIVFGMPLGLGKPNEFANALYRRAKEDPHIRLTICTALSLEKPRWSSDLERRFMEPFIKRLFEGYVELEYMQDLRSGSFPENVELMEFYCKAGSYLNVRQAQENYISSNYTHVWRDILDRGVNVTGQLVCKKQLGAKTFFSMSCNPEVALDLAPELHEQERQGRRLALVAQVNQNLPFMYGDAVVEPDAYNMVIDNPKYNSRLFGAPKMNVSTADYLIGLYASALVQDGGTLQIGIGSLGDALCYGLILRHRHNADYRRLLDRIRVQQRFGPALQRCGGLDVFTEGLGGSTEMLVDGYLELIKNDVIKRKTYNDVHIQRLLNQRKIDETVNPEMIQVLLDERVIGSRLTREDFDFLQEFGIFKAGLSYENGRILNGATELPADLSDRETRQAILDACLGTRLKNGILIHGGFFLGPEGFYRTLREMSEEERRQIFMTSVLNVNQLYANNPYASETLKLLQRKKGRFINACLMVTLLGAAVSDGLQNGQVVSGVGGQYNFVTQAHALPDARSILMCKSTRAKGKAVSSNIVWNYGHITIPRHLRDIVVTEYGIADLRGKSDKEVIAALICVADSRFQEELLQRAKKERKIPDNYQIPDMHKENYPERLEADLAASRQKGLFPPFPFGTDFTQEELIIGQALKALQTKMSEGLSKVSSIGKAMAIRTIPDAALPYLKRLDLDSPATAREKILQRIVVHALSSSGRI